MLVRHHIFRSRLWGSLLLVSAYLQPGHLLPHEYKWKYLLHMSARPPKSNFPQPPNGRSFDSEGYVSPKI